MFKDSGQIEPTFPELLDLPAGLDPYEAIKPAATMSESA
jgi:hypothetical protein